MSAADAFATSQKLRRLDGADGVVFFCPACQDVHQIMLAGPTHWTADGPPDYPTFWPSIKVTKPALVDDEICHSFITRGRISYADDCTHAMKGKVVDMPLWPHPPKKYGGILEPKKA
jgi:hypothetical protein